MKRKTYRKSYNKAFIQTDKWIDIRQIHNTHKDRQTEKKKEILQYIITLLGFRRHLILNVIYVPKIFCVA